MAFSFAAGETIEWYSNSYGDEDDLWYEIPLLDRITDGKNVLGKDSEETINVELSAHIFNAETEGWYLFTLSDLAYLINNGIFFSEDYIDGKAYGLQYEDYFQRSNDTMEFLFRLPEGESVLLLQCIEKLTLTYEFVGKEITDIVFPEDELTGLIGMDIVEGSVNSFVYDVDAEAVFDEEKTYEIKDGNFSFKGDAVKGENNITLNWLGFEKEVTYNAFEIRDVVTKLEPVGFEEDLVAKEYYNGSCMFSGNIEAKLVVTYADGRTETVDFNDGSAMITLFNGRKYTVNSIIESDTLSAVVCLGEEVYGTYDLEVVSADYDENLAMLSVANFEWLSQAKRDLDWRLAHLEYADNFAEKFSLVFWIPGIYTNAFYQIFCNIVEFIEFYI